MAASTMTSGRVGDMIGRCIDFISVERPQDKYVYVDGGAQVQVVGLGAGSDGAFTLRATGDDDFHRVFKTAKLKGLQ